jgi:hypothetical protein
MFDNSFLDIDDEEIGEWDDPEDRCYRREIDDGESFYEEFARLAEQIEAGSAQTPPGWKLDRPRPGVLVWTTPSGRRYASTLTGYPLPLSKADSLPLP